MKTNSDRTSSSPEVSQQSGNGLPLKGNSTKANAIEIPTISLPKGGGALKGIDETFQVNAANGTASCSFPVPISLSRGGFQPSLTVAYNSGVGNSLFGVGWGMDSPAIQRRTDRKLPQYKDADESDVFLFSGAEDLVPVLDANQQVNVDRIGSFDIRLYRPRIEGVFAKIERINPTNERDFFWKITTKDNVVTFFGVDEASRISDPNDTHKIFKWLPTLSFDDKGNCLVYSYKSENKDNVQDQLNEKNRLIDVAVFTNKHLKRVQYGNKIPYYPAYVADPTKLDSIYQAVMPTDDFMFEVVIDYGEHSGNHPSESTTWPARNDAYSDYRAGFEIRTYRQCQRILMFHRFAELGPQPLLVRSLNFTYESSIGGTVQQAELSYLTRITQTGFSVTGASSSLPPLMFNYQALHWHTDVKTINPEAIANAPVGIATTYQWVDFFGEGISGILSEQADAWYYKRNLGNGNFTNALPISPKPSWMGISNGGLSLQDIEATGKKYIVSQTKGLQGYFEQTDENDWLPFKPFTQVANIDTTNPNVKFIDLNGDGRPDLVISDETVFTWYPSKGTIGYDSPELASKPFDDEKGPAIVFADSTQRIYLADMSGDGLTDIVQIENQRVCYWPNLGYGRFGAKVTLSNFQGFDYPDLFNPSYIHLADVSGTGATDIVYLGKSKFRAYLNLSGNALSNPFDIDPFWDVTQPNQLSVVDLLGTGTSCLVWSSPLPSYASAPMQYMDLMGGVKPHIMVTQRNGMGKETTVTYKSSAQFYLDDKKANKPWTTKLPFPVQCVSQVEVVDTVSDLRFCTQYAYHHGYYDHPEREFRGFGLVEQIDTEEYQYLKNKNAANATDIVFHEKPIITKTWYHTGAFLAKEKILDQFRKDYWFSDPFFVGQPIEEITLPDAQLPPALSIDELVEAHRACKGMVLRQEVFAVDGSEKEKIPFSVATHTCHIQLLQPKTTNAHAVFLVQESEAITYSYERNLGDPRIAHTLNLEIDTFGNVLKGVSVVYGRKETATTDAIDSLDASLQKHSQFIKTAQTKEHLIYTETKTTTDAQEEVAGKLLIYYRLPIPFSVKTYEVAGVPKANPGHYQLTDFRKIIEGNVTIRRYEESVNPPPETIVLRLIEDVETRLLSYDLETSLPVGRHGALGMAFESYQLAFTPELIDVLFNTGPVGNLINPPRVTDVELKRAQYLQKDTNWWIRSGEVHFFDRQKGETRATAQNRFYLPIAFTDPFGSITQVDYPANKTFLFVEKTIDALGNETRILAFDYRVLAPRITNDINDNRSEVSFDALGFVAGMALLGKGNQADDLTDFNADLTEAQISDFFQNPFAMGKDLLKNATTRTIYDLQSIPARVGSLVRETHVRNEDGALNPEAILQVSFEYKGGMGNVVLQKVRAEAGKAKKVANGLAIEVDANPRWVGNGRTILNNKGKPVKQYEPYFSTTHLYEDEAELREIGVTPLLHYDAAGRQVRTDFPDGTLTRIEYDSWQQKTYDQNDTVLESTWKAHREDPDPNSLFRQKLAAYGGDINKEIEALNKTRIHHDTPTVILTDSLGRPFYSIAHNRWEVKEALADPQLFEEFTATRVILDSEGNPRAVVDARDNTVMTYDYDMLGHVVHQRNLDAGERWLLNDCMGKPTWGWDSKNQRFETVYDLLHRPTESTVTQGNNAAIPFEKIQYGTAADKSLNLNGATIRHFDTAGVLETLAVDFKGAVKKNSRQLLTKTDEQPDWLTLSAEVFTSTAQFDALGRPIETISPHDETNPVLKPSVYKPIYNEANLLNQVVVSVRQTPDRFFVTNIEYDAKGQRTQIEYGNNTSTRYNYDPDTLRLRRLQTRSTAGAIFQDLLYTYDPVGNISSIEDKAQQALFFTNSFVQPINTYRYDATYRLIEAQGREHIGQNQPSTAYDKSRLFRSGIPTGDNALRNYTERYLYDGVGNMQKLQHIANGGSWTRNFQYANNSSRLVGTELGAGLVYEPYVTAPTLAEKYPYDSHGNMTQMPHLPGMDWNFKDQLHHIQILAGADNDQSDGATYTYDASGQRIRKIVTKGNLTEERLYLGGFEIFRKKQGNTLLLERESLHIMDNSSRIALVESLTIAPPGNEEPTQLIRYQFSNHLGTACLELTDEPIPRIISYEEYHPYGSTAYQNQNATIKAAAKCYRYTGMERDEESGLNYHTARYYAPWLCRWTAADPIGIGDGVNMYAYVHGNPTRGVDWGGMQECTASPFVCDPKFYKAPGTVRPPTSLTPEQMESVARRNLEQRLVDLGDKDGCRPNEPLRVLEYRVAQLEGRKQDKGPSAEVDPHPGRRRQTIVHLGGALGIDIMVREKEEVYATDEEAAAMQQDANNEFALNVGMAALGGVAEMRAHSNPSSPTKSTQKSTPKPPSDPYDVKAWGEYYKQNPTVKRSVGAAAADDPAVFTPPETKKEANLRVEKSRERFLASGGQVRVIVKPVHEHHIASDKAIASGWTAKFQALFDKAGMTLQNQANKVPIEGHQGAHGENYHRIIYERLSKAVEGKPEHTQAYMDALSTELTSLSKDIATPGSTLNRMVTGR